MDDNSFSTVSLHITRHKMRARAPCRRARCSSSSGGGGEDGALPSKLLPHTVDVRMRCARAPNSAIFKIACE